MSDYPLQPTTSCYLQGGQYLKMDARLQVLDQLQNVVHKFPLADFGAIADQGEFGYNFLLTETNPSMVFDETLTGYTGDTAATDVDFIYLATTVPLIVKLGVGKSLNSVVPGSRNPSGSQFEVYPFLVWHTNNISGLTLDTNSDQRVLPMGVYLPGGTGSAQVTIYLAKFTR